MAILIVSNLSVVVAVVVVVVMNSSLGDCSNGAVVTTAFRP